MASRSDFRELIFWMRVFTLKESAAADPAFSLVGSLSLTCCP